ncbi:MAG: hypothetical protein QOH06_5147 [Acidobacteriota bacterium]|jgi:hypothetical protein|nr:hypothetical protein [Acidobacteriota bacterium]
MKSLRLLICLLGLAGPLRAAGLGELPIVFEPNVGQTDPRVQFLSRGPGSTLFLAGTEAVLKLSGKNTGAVLRIGLEGAGPGTAQALEPLPGLTHYYVGNDPAKWHTGVPQFGRVKLAGIYPGIDLVWYGRERNLEFDFLVAPGADPDAIRLNLKGAEHLEIAPSGDLILHLAGGSLTFQRPVSYQEVDGKRREVSSSYRLADGRLGFDLGDYDRGRPLVIDPVIEYSSFLGGSSGDSVSDIAADSAGNLYATGTTDSTDFPEGFASPEGESATFVTRIDPEGQGIVFTTILDGSKLDTAISIAVDDQGAAYVTGQTDSRDLPILNAFQSRLGFFVNQVLRMDAFVAKLTSSGTVVFCTYLGGGLFDSGAAIAVDVNRRVYVAGSTDARTFPLKNEFQGDAIAAGSNAFLTVFAADGQSLVYSTLLRGGSDEGASGLAVDAAGNAYLSGGTDSTDFPVKGAFQSSNRGGKDAFVAKINPAASGEASLVYSTYLGGQGRDVALDIAVDAFAQAHVTGITGSTLFPLREPLDSSNVVNEVFVTKLNAQGNALLFSTFLGGTGEEVARSIALDGAGAIYVTGTTDSADFPAVNAFQPELSGADDAFVAKIDPATSTLLWSSFLGGDQDEFDGGIALDGRGNVYLGGQTQSLSFPILNAVQGSFGGGSDDGYITKLESTAPDTIGFFRPSVGKHFLHDSNLAGPPDSTVTLGQAGDLPVAGDWLGIGDRPGIFRAGIFTLKRFNNDILCCNLTFAFGEPGDLPVAGDWNGDGIDTVGVFRPSTGQFILTDTNGLSIDRVFNFGELGDLPVAGDWDGDGIDTVGIFRPADGLFVLTNTDGLSLDFIFNFGQSGDLPVMGDWNGDGLDTAGVLRGGRFELRNSNDAGPADLTVAFRLTGLLPIAGDWNGKP